MAPNQQHQQQQRHLSAMPQHVETWVEPVDSNRSRWLFRFAGKPDRTVAYPVTIIHLPLSENVGPFYVVKVPDTAAADKPHGWPLTRLDYTIRDRIVFISDTAFAQRLVEMTYDLVIRSVRALASAKPAKPDQSRQPADEGTHAMPPRATSHHPA